jgi:hypothetical protein
VGLTGESSNQLFQTLEEWERMPRVSAQFPDPFAQHILMEIKVAGSLGDRHASFLDQSHRLKLELAAEFPSLHSQTPASSKTRYLGVHETGSRPIKK